MKKIVFLFIILISFSAVNIFSQETLSLDNAIRLGIKNNSQLLSQEQEMIIASQRVTEAKFLYLPIINFSAGTIASNVDYPVVLSDDFLSRYIDPNNKNAIYSVGVVAKQYLYAGGRHKSTVRLAKSYLKEAQNGYDTIKNNASFDIKQKFYEAVYKDERLTTSQKFLGMTKKIIANISDYSTKMQAEIITLTEIENDIHAFTNEAEASKLQLIKSLNKELDFDIKYEGKLTPKNVEIDLDKAKLWAMEFRPEFRSALYDLEEDDIAVKLSMSRSHPSVLLLGGYENIGYSKFGGFDNYYGGLFVNLPLPYDISTQVKQKKAERRQGSLKEAKLIDEIMFEVIQSFEDLKFWKQETLRRENLYKSVNSKYKRIDKTTMNKYDYLQVTKAKYSVYQDYLYAMYKQVLSEAKVEHAIGRDTN